MMTVRILDILQETTADGKEGATHVHLFRWMQALLQGMPQSAVVGYEWRL